MKSCFSFIFLGILMSIGILSTQTIPKRVLLEEFSTCPCGFCPEGGIIAEQLIHKYPNLYTFTHHAGFGTDSMTIPESLTIANKYTTFAPGAVIDRGNYPIPIYTDSNFIAISRQKWDSVCAVRLNDTAEAEISIEKSFDESQRSLDVTLNVRFVSQVQPNDYRVNLAIIEDSVTGIGKGYDQKNYFNNDQKYPTLYKKGDSIVGYPHRHVIRALPTGTWGLAGVFPNSPEIDKIYNYKLTGYKIPLKWKTKDISLVAFLSYYNANAKKHRVLNSDETKLIEVNESNPEYAPDLKNITMSINPNPVTDLAYIECYFPVLTTARFEIFNSNGIKINDIKQSDFLSNSYVYFSASDLAPGLYFVKMTYNSDVISKKFLVI